MPTSHAMFRILSVTCLLTRKALRLIIISDQRMCLMLSGFACVYVVLYLLISSLRILNLYCYRHCGCPVCVSVSVRSFLPPRASIARNIGTYVFTATRKTLYIGIIIVIFAENASFRSYGRRHLLAPNATNRSRATKYGYRRNPRRQHLIRAHILNINMCTYMTSAHGHEKAA